MLTPTTLHPHVACPDHPVIVWQRVGWRFSEGVCPCFLIYKQHAENSEKAMAPTPVLLPGKSHG